MAARRDPPHSASGRLSEALGHEQIAEPASVRHGLLAFPPPHVEVNPAGRKGAASTASKMARSGEPERWTHRRRSPEDVGTREEGEEADEPTHRGAGDAGRAPVGDGAIARVHQRLDRLRQVGHVLSSPAGPCLRIVERAVLRQPPLARVPDPDRDPIEPPSRRLIHGDVHPPRAGEALLRVEEILAILQVEHGVVALAPPVGGGKIYGQVAVQTRSVRSGLESFDFPPWPPTLFLHHSPLRLGRARPRATRADR